MEVQQNSNLDENSKRESIQGLNTKNNINPYNYLDKANLGFLPKFRNEAYPNKNTDYQNPTFNPDNFNNHNRKEMQILENTVNSVYIPEENLIFNYNSNNNYNNNDALNTNINYYTPNFTLNKDLNIDPNYNFNLNENSANIYNHNPTNNANLTANNHNNSNINNFSNSNNNNIKNHYYNSQENKIYNPNSNYDIALQKAEKLLKNGFHEYSEKPSAQLKHGESLYTRYKSEHNEFPQIDELVKETYFYPSADDFDNNHNANLYSNADLLCNNAYVIENTESNFDNKIGEILEKRNQQIKQNFIETQNNQFANLLKEIELLKQKNFEQEDSNFKFKSENE
jgi:hypothetical protein